MTNIRTIALCGAGAIGSNLADILCRRGWKSLVAIDHDRVEQRNVSSQLYGLGDVGGWKVDVLRNRLFRDTGIEVVTHRKRLDNRNISKLLRGADLVIDCFDNTESRQIVTTFCRASRLPCLHIGLFEGYGEVLWNEAYRVPTLTGTDVCDDPFSRSLVLMVTSVAAETVRTFLENGAKTAWTITQNDFAVRPLEMSDASS